MKKGYYTDNQGRCLGGWELKEKPDDTDEYKWFEADAIPAIYQPRTRQIILSEIKSLEEGILYSMIDGDEQYVASKKAQRLALKQELRNAST